jgi:hypothetical protein
MSNTTLPTTDEMQRLLIRAQEGDITCLTELRSLLDSRPDLWQKVGDLAEHAELITLRLVAGENLHIMEAVQRKLAELKIELAGPSPTPVEKILVERIGICWLQVYQLDIQATVGLGATSTPQGVYAQKKLDSAHRRFLLAVKQLAVVRKLLRPDLPAIQIAAILARQLPMKKGARLPATPDEQTLNKLQKEKNNE